MASDTGARARWAAGGAWTVAIAPQPLLCIWHALPLLLQALLVLASTSAALGLCCSLLATLDGASWARGRGEPGQRSSRHSHVAGHGSGMGVGRGVQKGRLPIGPTPSPQHNGFAPLATKSCRCPWLWVVQGCSFWLGAFQLVEGRASSRSRPPRSEAALPCARLSLL